LLLGVPRIAYLLVTSGPSFISVLLMLQSSRDVGELGRATLRLFVVATHRIGLFLLLATTRSRARRAVS
jgi:hypothetical protein